MKCCLPRQLGLQSLGNLVLVIRFTDRMDIWERPLFFLGKMGKGTYRTHPKGFIQSLLQVRKKELPFPGSGVTEPWWTGACAHLSSPHSVVVGSGVGAREGYSWWTRWEKGTWAQHESGQPHSEKMHLNFAPLSVLLSTSRRKHRSGASLTLLQHLVGILPWKKLGVGMGKQASSQSLL